MIPLDPLPNLIDQAYTRILEAIIDRTLPPGHRIRQNELAEKLGVSRQPVSHALHLLHRHDPQPEPQRPLQIRAGPLGPVLPPVDQRGAGRDDRHGVTRPHPRRSDQPGPCARQSSSSSMPLAIRKPRARSDRG